MQYPKRYPATNKVMQRKASSMVFSDCRFLSLLLLHSNRQKKREVGLFLALDSFGICCKLMD